MIFANADIQLKSGDLCFSCGYWQVAISGSNYMNIRYILFSIQDYNFHYNM